MCVHLLCVGFRGCLDGLGDGIGPLDQERTEGGSGKVAGHVVVRKREGGENREHLLQVTLYARDDEGRARLLAVVVGLSLLAVVRPGRIGPQTAC